LAVATHFRGEHGTQNAVAFGIYLIVQLITRINEFMIVQLIARINEFFSWNLGLLCKSFSRCAIRLFRVSVVLSCGKSFPSVHDKQNAVAIGVYLIVQRITRINEFMIVQLIARINGLVCMIHRMQLQLVSIW